MTAPGWGGVGGGNREGVRDGGFRLFILIFINALFLGMDTGLVSWLRCCVSAAVAG